jgi:hypothetical protein
VAASVVGQFRCYTNSRDVTLADRAVPLAVASPNQSKPAVHGRFAEPTLPPAAAGISPHVIGSVGPIVTLRRRGRLGEPRRGLRT